ncbi:hypothetical protein JOF53_006357 [Crossiella equi]|uniref:Uncharacterized protein n=1 Tax=Crossiella equi TaxID=130796 RepID=A0ABS5ALP2_9PSEU|nr:hypothetical protein [Crossiella equi]MBP2477485.1 hypothetical protein [Crossiella equi]
MSPAIAFNVITWVAILLLFLGLAAVLREIRLLREEVRRSPDSFAAAPPDLRLGERLAGGARRIVLAADSGCPLCLAVLDRVLVQAPGAVLLTHEPESTWTRVAGQLTVISDPEVWRAVSHLAPPVLMLVDGTGRAERVHLPVRVAEVDAVLAEWQRIVVRGHVDAA